MTWQELDVLSWHVKFLSCQEPEELVPASSSDYIDVLLKQKVKTKIIQTLKLLFFSMVLWTSIAASWHIIFIVDVLSRISSLHFNGHFPSGPGLAGTRMSQFWILLELTMTEVVVTTGAIRRAKLQSNRHHQQTTPSYLYRPDCPTCRPTNSVNAPTGKFTEQIISI